MIVGRRLLFVLSALSLTGGFAVAVLTGCSGSSVAGLVELVTLAPLLVTVALVLSVIACFSDQGEGGGGDDGIGNGGIDLPERPTGGIAFDWDAFEAEFRTYAERQVRAL